MSGLLANVPGLDVFSIRFVFPGALLLLLLLPWSVHIGRRIRSLSPGRKWAAIVLRCFILICLVGALAGAELVRENDRLAVFFLLDRSNSVPESKRQEAVEAVNTLSSAFMTPKDEAGIIAFGDEPSIELPIGNSLEIDQIQSYISGEQTDLAAAVRLAIAAFPQGYMRRIVILTDGNETRGSALEEVKLARASGAQVDVVPIHIGGGSEVRIAEVSAPDRVNAGEPFRVRVVVKADQDCEATLRLYQRVRDGAIMLPPTRVTLQKGANAFLLPQELAASGFYEYEAVVESDADTIQANNEGRAFTIIHGEPAVLYVDGDPAHSRQLEPALRREGINVVRGDLGSMPTSLAQFQNFDAVVLSDVGATDLTSEQINALEAMVRDLGVGLVMIGGPNAFGAGGFYGTAVEKALPVNMDLKQRKVMPQGALALIMHTCEFADGNAWAREIALAALHVLSSQDLMGALAYDWQGGDSWLYELQRVGDGAMMERALNTTQIGDMPAVQPTLQMAYDALRACTASVKRVVLISDGDPSPPSRSLLTAMAAEAIAVSTVCINPHSPSDEDMLKWVAYETGGNYYFVNNPSKLPQIFSKEAAVVKRGMLIEEEFTPAPFNSSEILQGIAAESLPSLLGYVATTPKENATIALVSHEDDPVLAQWRYGLGKAVAFTSDVTTRWAANWVTWEEFSRFWAQTVRWAMRDARPSNLRVETRVKDGKGYVRVDAVDDEGRFVNFLCPRGTVTGPAPQFSRQELHVTQTGPGIYEGTFPLHDRGVYMINMTYTRQDGSEGMIPTGLALDYSREYEYNTTNLPLLEQLAAFGGGRVRSSTDNPFEHSLESSPTISPIWPYLVVIAACVFPVEIFVRRVVIDFRVVLAGSIMLLRRLPGLKRLLPELEPRRGQLTGAYGTMSAPSEGLVFTATGSFSLEGAQVVSGIEADRPETDVVSADKLQAEGRPEYTRQLLAAKERALEKRKRK